MNSREVNKKIDKELAFLKNENSELKTELTNMK
jgi:hypothetical protein